MLKKLQSIPVLSLLRNTVVRTQLRQYGIFKNEIKLSYDKPEMHISKFLYTTIKLLADRMMSDWSTINVVTQDSRRLNQISKMFNPQW